MTLQHVFLLIMVLLVAGGVIAEETMPTPPTDAPIVVLVSPYDLMDAEDADYRLRFFTVQPNINESEFLFEVTMPECEPRCFIWEFDITHHLILASHVETYQDGLYRILPDERRVELIDVNLWGPSGFSLSPDGASVAYIRRNQVEWKDEIVQGYLLTLSDLLNAPVWGGETEIPRQFAPAWDPQNEWVLFFTIGLRVNEHDEDELDYRIYRVPTGGAEQAQWLTEGSSPTWSPDGEYIAYCVGLITEAILFRMGRDGENPQALTEMPKRCEQLRWSPDGDTLILSDAYNLFLIDAQQGDIQTIFESDEVIGDVRWSPDGEQIALLINDGLYVMMRDGSNVRHLLPDMTITAIDWPASIENTE